MPQKKKTTNKKSHKKKHLNQNNKNVSFAPAMQQQSRTDNLVGDLVGRLINKIENDRLNKLKIIQKKYNQ